MNSNFRDLVRDLERNPGEQSLIARAVGFASNATSNNILRVSVNPFVGQREIRSNKNDIANSSYGNSSYNVQYDNLTTFYKDVIEQEIARDDIELSNVIGTSVAIAPYAETVKHFIRGSSGGKLSDYAISANHTGSIKASNTQIGSFDTKRQFYAISLGSNVLEVRQQEFAKIQITDPATQLRACLQDFLSLTEQGRAFGKKQANGSHIGGLLTPNPQYGIAIDQATLTTPLPDISAADMETFFKSILVSAAKKTGGINRTDTLVMPHAWIQGISTRYDGINGTYMTKMEVIEKILSSASKSVANSRPIKIVGSTYLDGDVNKDFGFNNGKGEDFVIALDSNKSLAFFDNPIPLELLSTVDTGFVVNNILIAQMGEVTIPRPEFYSIFSIPRV